MQVDYRVLIEQHRAFIEKILTKDKLRILLLLCSKEMRNIKKAYFDHKKEDDEENEFLYLAHLSDCIDRNLWYRFWVKVLCEISDFMFEIKYRNQKGNIKKKMRECGEMYLSIVCIIKNEARYIREWVAYYKLQGVDHIYLFDNGSTDNVAIELKAEIAKGYVTLINFRGANAQLPLYRMTAKYLKGKSRWVAYIDADEFVLSSEGSFREYLVEKEMYAALGINWVVFGPGKHEMRPEGLVIENYNQTFEDTDNLLNLRIKSVVNPSVVYNVTSPHFCILKQGKYAVDEEGKEITTKWMYVSGAGAAFTGKNKTRNIRINHYWTKSKQDLKEKCSRGYAAGGFSPDYDNILKRLDYPQKTDCAIEKYIADVKKNMSESGTINLL